MSKQEIPFADATKPVEQILARVASAASRTDKGPDTIDILLAMLEQKGSVAEVALLENGISIISVERSAKKQSLPIPLLSLKELSRRCSEEAKLLGHSYPGTEHLLLAICTSSQCRGARVLFDIDGHDRREAICRSIINILGHDWQQWRSSRGRQLGGDLLGS